MKKNIFIYVLTAIFALSSCSLDDLPAGDTVTEDQKDEVVLKDPEKIEAEVKALAANMIRYNTLESSGASHDDFGYAAACLMYESSGFDFVADDVGFNWFRGPLTYSNRLSTSEDTEFLWRLFYNNVKQANDILAIAESSLESVEDKGERDKFLYYRGQALVYRAFSYLNLVQNYQQTYIGHENAPAVPLTLVEGDERATAKRATVQEVYDVIIDDLTLAIESLEGKKRKSKTEASLEVAYGLRARAYLVMNKWKEAASDAKKAQVGFTPYSYDELSQKPAFNSSSSQSWMWANIISPDNDIVKTGIINWPSHLCSLTGNGYTTGAGVYKRINMHLWQEIPESDVRKLWWVDEDIKSPWYDDYEVGVDKDGNPVYIAQYLNWKPYTNIKFGPYKDEMFTTVNSSDWPIMRVEEMILIEAEALAMSGDLAGGKVVLNNFIQTYRDPSYAGSQASSPEEFQDEVWIQRRVELWGEGFSSFDILRLKKGTERYKLGSDGQVLTNYDATSRINLKPEDPIFLYLLPEAEIEANLELDHSDNNETIARPEPI